MELTSNELACGLVEDRSVFILFGGDTAMAIFLWESGRNAGHGDRSEEACKRRRVAFVSP
jgi:hypothetical protein